VLSLDYYAHAMQAILARVRTPVFFIFSDDIPFTREHLPALAAGQRMVFVDHNDEANPHEDLRLMSSCRHHIIANSTFSWWGAWLNPDPAKLVCAPKGWGLANPAEWSTDLIPPNWLLSDAEIAPN
jgi:hypothetical protein